MVGHTVLLILCEVRVRMYIVNYYKSVNSAVGCLRNVDVVIADVSEAHAASVF
jgi:hypothetical protein